MSATRFHTHTKPRATQITTNVGECGPCPVFASFTLAFALQLRKKHGKSCQCKKTNFSQGTINLSQSTVQYTYYQNTHTLRNLHFQTPASLILFVTISSVSCVTIFFCAAFSPTLKKEATCSINACAYLPDCTVPEGSNLRIQWRGIVECERVL